MEQSTIETIERFRGLIRTGSRYNYNMSDDGKLSFILAGATKSGTIGDTRIRQALFGELYLRLLDRQTDYEDRVSLRQVDDSIVALWDLDGNEYDIGTIPADNGLNEEIFTFWNQYQGCLKFRCMRPRFWNNSITVIEIICDFTEMERTIERLEPLPGISVPAPKKVKVSRPRKKAVAPTVIEAPKNEVINYDIILDDINDVIAFALSTAYSHYLLTQVGAIL